MQNRVWSRAAIILLGALSTFGCNDGRLLPKVNQSEKLPAGTVASSDTLESSQPIDFEFIQSEGSEVSFSAGRSDSHSLGANLKVETFAKMPKWDRRNPNPPVSANQAMLAALKYRLQLADEKIFPNGGKIGSVALMPFDPEIGDWYWRVKFEVVQAGNEREWFDVTVLMDGSVKPLDVSRRLDKGWPPRDEKVAPHNGTKTDVEIVRTFVAELNPKRTFAGQDVEIQGIVRRIPDDQIDNETGHHLHFTTDDGTVLILGSYTAWPVTFGKRLSIQGRLVGYRNQNDDGESWEGLTLFPGIEFHGGGFAED